MRPLNRIATIVAHEFRIARRDVSSVMILLVFPIITIAFLKPAFEPALRQAGYVRATGAEQVVPGQAAMAAFFVVALVTYAFFSEHSWGTWDRLRASHASSIEIVVGKALPRALMGAAQITLLFVVGVLVFDLHIAGPPVALVPPAAAFCVCLTMLGVCVTALCRSAQQAGAFAYLGMVLFGAIGGAFVPFGLLPGWARAIAPVTPTYWVMRSMRSVVLDGHGLRSVVTPTIVLLGMATLFAVVAGARMRFDEAKVGWN
jgi:ABC-2 type transport system permease protein